MSAADNCGRREMPAVHFAACLPACLVDLPPTRLSAWLPPRLPPRPPARLAQRPMPGLPGTSDWPASAGPHTTSPASALLQAV